MSDHQMTQEERDNRSRQLDPEHDAYHRSRGLEGRDDTTPIHTEDREEDQS